MLQVFPAYFFIYIYQSPIKKEKYQKTPLVCIVLASNTNMFKGLTNSLCVISIYNNFIQVYITLWHRGISAACKSDGLWV